MKLTRAVLLLYLQTASVASLALNKVDDVTSARLAAERDSAVLRRSGSSDHSNVQRAEDTNSYTSTTWSGAVAGDGKSKFQSVSASIIVPEATFPYGFNSSETYGASAWVGIGGMFSKNTSLIQTGFYYSWTTDGLNKGIYAFYEWFPDPAQWYTVSDIQVGDNLKLHVEVQQDGSLTAGTVVYENLTNDPPESVSLNITAPNELPTDGLSADWIVENWLTDGQNVPNWGHLEFTNLKATFEGGEAADLSDPNLFAWPVNGQPYAAKGNDTVIFPGAIDVKALTAGSTWQPWV